MHSTCKLKNKHIMLLNIVVQLFTEIYKDNSKNKFHKTFNALVNNRDKSELNKTHLMIVNNSQHCLSIWNKED